MMAGLQACNVMVETCIPALLPEVWQASCLCRKHLLRNLTQQPAELVELVKVGGWDRPWGNMMGWGGDSEQNSCIHLYSILVSYSFMQCHYIIQWGQDTPWWDLPQSPSAKPGISLFPRVRSGRLCSLPLATGSGAPRMLDMNLYNPYPQEQTPCSMVRRGFWHFDSILPSIQWKCGHLGRHPSPATTAAQALCPCWSSRRSWARKFNPLVYTWQRHELHKSICKETTLRIQYFKLCILLSHHTAKLLERICRFKRRLSSQQFEDQNAKRPPVHVDIVSGCLSHMFISKIYKMNQQISAAHAQLQLYKWLSVLL